MPGPGADPRAGSGPKIWPPHSIFPAPAPIHERGTPEQRAHYMALAAPPAPGEDRHTYRGAFCLTEPIPYVGVDTGMLSGKVSVTEWSDGKEPLLHVEKRG